MNLARLLEDSARKFSWRRCLISESGGYRFRTLNRKANQLAWGLKGKLGIKKGDKVAILLNNCPEFIIALFAVLKLGAICVPLNVFLAFDELRSILQDCRAKLIISSSDFRELLPKFVQMMPGPADSGFGLENIVLTDKREEGFLYLPNILADEGGKAPPESIQPQDLAFLVYTSGTTGVPKGVMLSHGNLSANVLSSVQALEITPQDRILLILPMFHSFTLTVCILVPIYTGAKIVIIKSLKPFPRVLRSIIFNRITIVVGIPHLYDILKNLKVPPILQLLLRTKVCISGAAPLSIETIKTFKEKFSRMALLEGYGLTEASPVVSFNPLKGMRKPGSIGRPLPGVEVKVVKEDESEAAVEEIGELIVKGPNVMQGYYQRPEETGQALRGGWLFTGDMAKIDRDGYIYIVGRKKEMIISHGMNVYPSEIEKVLSTHPKVKEVAVVGRKDAARGEIPVAFVVLNKDCAIRASEIIDFCKGKLANYKIPRSIEFREDLPKTPTGKVLKRKLVSEETPR